MKQILTFLVLAIVANARADELKIVTLNVLATPWKAEQRMPALFAELAASDADIIALQEVAPWIATKLQEEPWINRYHYPKSKSGDMLIAHEFVTLTKEEPTALQTLQLPSSQNRIAFLTTIPLGDSQLTIASIHLDSFLEDGPIRAQQLSTLFKNLDPTSNVVLLGDFNFGHGEQPDTAALSPDYADLWLELESDSPGYTWDRKRNKRAQIDSFEGELSRRLDRILIKGKWYEAKSIELFADTPISHKKDRLYPSDHFGLKAIVETKKPGL